jgi:valyl-tRNA synthetase
MQEVQQLIRELRAFRSDKNLANRHALALEVRSSKPDLIQRFAPLIEDAANLQGIAFVAERPRNAHVVVSGVHELFIDAEAVGIDPTEERERIQTEIDYLRGFLQKVEQKLNNERFINNAPAEVVEKERQKQRDTQERLRVLENSLAQLQA